MGDKGIIFSAPMVRALLDGRKSQTRRLCAWANNPNSPALSAIVACDEPGWFGDEEGEVQFKVPYAPGDRLYVREACWIAPPGWTDSPVNPMGPQRQEVAFKADDRSGYTANAAADYKLRLRPSIHMPRWASRMWLAITDVRVQRLQDISEADAMAEGIDDDALAHFRCPIQAYRALWDYLHGGESDQGWLANPWVVAVSFTTHPGNIDKEPG